MPERAQEAMTAEQELDWYLNGLPAAPNLKQWMLGWLQRHQPPMLTRERILDCYRLEGITLSDNPTFDRVLDRLCDLALPPRLSREQVLQVWNEYLTKDGRIDALCALALPPRRAVTKEQLDQFFAPHKGRALYLTAADYNDFLAALHRLCTGAGEAPTGWCAHTKNLQSIEMITQDPGYPQIGSHVPAHEVLFCPVCTAPRPRPEAR